MTNRPKSPAKKGTGKAAQRELVIVVRASTITLDRLRQQGAKSLPRAHVDTGKGMRTYQDAFLVDQQTAADICNACHQQLCECNDKFSAPIILCWRIRGLNLRPLNRAELPVAIPIRNAA